MADQKLSALTTIPIVDRAADLLYVVDNSAGTSNKVVPNVLLGITGAPVGDTDVQTLSSKTITAPTISSPVLSGTITGTYTIGGTPTFPSAVVTLTGTQVLTNKTLTSPTINTATIANPTLTVDTISEFTSTNGVNIDGVNLKDGALNTNNSVVTANITDTAVTPAKLQTGTGASWAWQTWTPTFTNLTGGTLNYATYIQTGKIVTFKLKYTLAGAGISGSVSFTTPTGINPTGYSVGLDPINSTLLFTDASVSVTRIGTLVYASTTTLAMRYISATDTSINALGVNAPFTWAISDIIYVTGSYEAS